MPRVFISFRKNDDRWMRDRIYKALIGRFEASQFFKSGASIAPGSDFAPVLLRQAQDCEIMLVLIGSRWLDASDDAGHRFIDRDGDWVRTEIAAAIAAGNRVVPVLLGDSTMLPGPSHLPPDIAVLGRLQFLRVPETHLDAGLDNLLSALSRMLPDLADAPESSAAVPGTGDRGVYIGRDNSGHVSTGDNTTNVWLR
jgi:TIR domain